MSIQLSEQSAAVATVAVDCTVSVSRNADGDLVDGVETKLESADGVTVESVDLGGLQPGLNDLTVAARAELAVTPGVDATEHLETVFGVRDVSVESRKDPPE